MKGDNAKKNVAAAAAAAFNIENTSTSDVNDTSSSDLNGGGETQQAPPSPSIKLFGIILVISVGILFTGPRLLREELWEITSSRYLRYMHETEFQLLGFIFVMIAAVLSGFRWTMTQILLQKVVYGLQNPLVLMSFIAPVMAVSTGILSLIFEPWNEYRTNVYFDSLWHITRSCLLLLFGGTLAFFMVLTEYILVSVTSAVTVTIARVVKEVVTITVAVFYFHDEFTWLKGCGLVIILIGVSLFNWYKYQKLHKGDTSEDDLSGARQLMSQQSTLFLRRLMIKMLRFEYLDCLIRLYKTYKSSIWNL